MGSQPYTEEEKAEIRKAGEVLSYKLSIWKKHGNGKILFKGNIMNRSQSSFAMLLYPDLKKPQSRVSKWISGYSRIPSDKLNEIVRILSNDGIPTTKEEFRIHSEEEYRYNTEAVNKYIEENYGCFINKENTNSFRRFLLFIKSTIILEKDFPLWTSIVPVKSQTESIKKEIDTLDSDNIDRMFLERMLENKSGYMRALYNTLPEAAPSDYPEFQIETKKDGKKTLQVADLRFLADLERKVIKYILSEFDEHKDKLIDSTDRVNMFAIKKAGEKPQVYPDGSIALPSLDICKEISEDEMILLDPYYEAPFLSNEYNESSDNSKERDEK